MMQPTECKLLNLTLFRQAFQPQLVVSLRVAGLGFNPSTPIYRTLHFLWSTPFKMES